VVPVLDPPEPVGSGSLVPPEPPVALLPPAPPVLSLPPLPAVVPPVVVPPVVVPPVMMEPSPRRSRVSASVTFPPQPGVDSEMTALPSASRSTQLVRMNVSL
jgi:hypothetical protein